MSFRSGLRRTPGADLAGRDRELRVLVDHARAAALGEGQAVLLRGPAGIGKTKLLSTALDELEALSASVLTVTCTESGVAAYAAVRALFEPLHAAEGSGHDLLSGSARLALPALIPPQSGPTSAVDTYSVMHGLYWLVAGLATRGLVVLALDDIQWCDESSLRWLAFLLRRAEELPLLVLVTQRTEPHETSPEISAGICATVNCLPIDLAPLAEDAVADFLKSGFGVAPDAGFVAAALEITGGNPFLLGRVVHRLRDEVTPDAGHVRVLESAGRAAVAGPLLERLPVDVIAVARAIAVLGNEELEMVAALAGTQSGLARNAVRALRANDLLEPSRLDYTHDLIRAAVLDSVPPEELARLRERAATLLNDGGRPSEEVAVHLLPLDTPPQKWTVTVLREAAAAAESRGAPPAAARYLARALSVDQDDVAVLVRLSRALGQINPASAVQHLEHALELVSDPRDRVPIAMQYVMVSLSSRNSRRAFDLATEVSDALEAVSGPDPTPADRALRTAIQSALLISGLDEKTLVTRVGERFRDFTPPPGETAEERDLLGVLAWLGALQGSPAAEVAALADQALRIGYDAHGGWAVLGTLSALHLADHTESAVAAISGVMAHAQSRGEAWKYVWCSTVRAMMHHFTGNLTAALSDAQYSFDVINQESWSAGLVMPQVVLATLLVRQDDAAAADQLLGCVSRPRLAEATNEYHWFLMAKARTKAALGDADAALVALRTCGESLSDSGIGNPVMAPWWYESAELLAGLGRIAEGEAVLDAVAPTVCRWGTPRALGMLETARGVLASGDAAIERLRSAVDLLADSPAKLEQAKAQYLLGCRLLRRGDAEGARERLRRSIDVSVLCRDKQQLALSLPALAAAGGRMRHGTGSPADALTGSERRVAERAAEGATNREIAESLFITQRTVEIHLTSVYRKLAIGGRAELGDALSNH